MPSNAAELVRILNLNDDGADRYVGGHPGESLLAKVYGGQLIAQALVAATRTVDPGRPVHSLQTICLDVGRHGEPVQFEVERLRDGRSFSARAVIARQGGRPVLRLLASYQPREQGLSHQIPMPIAPPPGGLPLAHEVMAAFSNLSGNEWRVEWSGLDLRYVSGHLEGRVGRTPAVQQLWVRVKDRLPDDAVLHRHIVAYLSDLTMTSASLLPHGPVFGDLELPRATLNHSVWFHEDARADEWLFVDQRSPWAGGARGLSFATVYSADGRPVASLAQEGLIRPLGRMRRQLGFD
ncbi:acyl-CoA thioesterase [Nocardioides immobilis]|uniref:acyl-CoA thioesterase n=1 Tax=Nocardioides immobilis TaxID=2049295 RepID=UPI0015FB214E|nr:acyl-CoA thioesterase domain-containing protein [Nocardioides immobilis]